MPAFKREPLSSSRPGPLRRHGHLALVLAWLLAPSGALVAEPAPGIQGGPLPAAVVDSIPAALDADAKQNLAATGSCRSFFQDQPKADLCPNAAASADILRLLGASHPNLGVQALVVAPLPPGLAARADRNLVLYNLLQQFRTMEGISYYSASHGAVRVFFTASHRVKGPADRTPIGDPHYAAIEPAHDLYLEQDDSTFGKNLYSATVRALGGGATELIMSNVEEVHYGFLPVLKPGALSLTLVVQPSADGRFLYFYGNVGLKVIKVPGMETTVRNSFYNRIIALCNWYARQVAQA